MAREPEDVDWRCDGGQDEVDVEGPSPGGAAAGECAADDGAEDAACSPAEADEGVVEGSFFEAGEDGYVVEAAR